MMKLIRKNYIILGLLVGFVASLSSCVSEVSNIEPISVSIAAKIPGHDISFSTPPTVKLTNYSEGFEKTATANSDGTLTMDGLIPGIYSISVSGRLNAQEGLTVFGSEEPYLIKGNLKDVRILPGQVAQPLGVELDGARAVNILFKEIYYCGSKTPAGGVYFRDQFYEIYNNGAETFYLDSLCLSNVSPASGTPYSWPADPTNPTADPNKDYVYGLQVWMIPGTGKDHPLLPGQSIVIAQMAADHRSTPTLNPNSPVNLGSADYETYIKRADGLSIDYPAPNMTPAYLKTQMNQWLTSVFGPAMVIFKLDHKFDDSYEALPIGKTTAGFRAYRIPKKYVLDAVDCVPDPSKYNQKRIPAVLDAGFMSLSGTYIGKSIARKVLGTNSDGHIVLKDTNNSSDDFEIENTPVIRRYLK